MRERWKVLSRMNEYRGEDGSIWIEGDTLVLNHNRFLVVSFQTGIPRRIPLQAVSGVHLKPAGVLANGWITIGVGGAPAPVLRRRDLSHHGETVTFDSLAQERFRELYNWLLNVIEINHKRGIDPASVPYDAAISRAELRTARSADVQPKTATSGTTGSAPGTYDPLPSRERRGTVAPATQSTEQPEPPSATTPLQDMVHIGPALSKKAWAAVDRQSIEGDSPWFVLAARGAAGLLAAWDDRLAIIKTGALTSWMAGSFGGERATTFYFTDITAIEYNSGLLNGVLQILTPSYQGTRNADFWRGSTSSRNANSDDPYTLSNTLPLAKDEYQAAQTQLSELRRCIGATKGPATHTMTTQTDGRSELATQLRSLSDLHSTGALTSEEFAAAKARLLS